MKWFRTTDWASWYQNKKPQSWKWLILESIIYTKHLFKAFWAYVVVSLLETAYFFRVPFSTWKWGWISSKKLWWWCPAFVTLLNNHMDFGNFGSRQLNNGHHIHKLIGMADTVPQRPYIPLCLPDLGFLFLALRSIKWPEALGEKGLRSKEEGQWWQRKKRRRPPPWGQTDSSVFLLIGETPNRAISRENVGICKISVEGPRCGHPQTSMMPFDVCSKSSTQTASHPRLPASVPYSGRFLLTSPVLLPKERSLWTS